MTLSHQLLGDRVHLYKRENSRYWQCSTYLAGRNHRTTTKEEDLPHAKKLAEEWYLVLQLKHRAGELKGGKLFSAAAAKFEVEYAALTAGERNPRYVKGHSDRLRVHLLPFLGDKVVTEITPQTVQDYRVHRMTSKKHPKTGEVMRPARSTLHHEIVTLRHVLKTAQRQGWLKFIPDLSPAYKASGKISHRAWFSPEEYKILYKATRERAENPLNPRWKWESEQLHDFVLFMVNTGLRPDEALRLEFRDVEIVKDAGSKETILEISVRGKRGVGYCKSMPGAVLPFERLRERERQVLNPGERRKKKGSESLDPPKLTDRLFPTTHRELLNAILDEKELKTDREGLRRSAYSLRHTYICLRLMEGADIYQIAKNCRTSVEMIEKYYAAHIKNMIDASAVNVRRERSPEPPPKRKANAISARTAQSAGHPKRRR
jgi:integrase